MGKVVVWEDNCPFSDEEIKETQSRWKEFSEEEISAEEAEEVLTSNREDDYEFLQSVFFEVGFENPLIILADLGLWNGRVRRHKVIHDASLVNLLSIDGNDDRCLYYDDKDVKCDVFHHDGVNHFLYREFIGTEKELDELCKAWSTKDPSADDLIEKFSRNLLPAMKKAGY